MSGLVFGVIYGVIGLALFVPFARWWDREPSYRNAGPLMTLFMCCMWPLILACAAVWWASRIAYDRATVR